MNFPITVLRSAPRPARAGYDVIRQVGLLFWRHGGRFDTDGCQARTKGSHGHDANLPDLHAVFVAWGTGIKPGVNLGDIDNRSVAPTIAKLLGIEMPGVEGKP